jgi:MFS family permease
MTIGLANTTNSKGFYGWIALSGAVFSLLIICASGQCFGVFLPVMSDEFGWNRGAIALALSLGMLASGLPSPLWGILAAKFGPRINIILGSALVGAGMAGLYFLHDIWYLYLLYIFVGIGSGLGGNIPSTTIAVNWFTKRVSMAQGIIATAAGLAGFIFPPLATALIIAVGWRLSWVILGGIILLGASVIGGIVLVRNRPEDMGQAPDGIQDEISEASKKAWTSSKQNANRTKLGIKTVLKMPVTWFIFFLGTANAVVSGTMITHQVAYMQDIGLSPMTAATTMSILAIGSIIGSLAFGALALRINIRYLGVSAFIALLIALVILLTTRELAFLYIYSALVGGGLGALLAALPTFIGVYFGRELYTRLMGIAVAIHGLGASCAGTIAGIIYDAKGSYMLAFIILLVFVLVGIVCVFLARKPNLAN